jgi:hypothetical protein
MTYKIGDRVRRYRRSQDLGTVVEVCDDSCNGYIVQMDKDEAGMVLMAPAYLLYPTAK